MRSAPLPREPLLTPHEVSTYLGVPTSTLAVWRSTGRVQLPYVKVGGHVRYRQDDIEGFLAGEVRDIPHAAPLRVVPSERKDVAGDFEPEYLPETGYYRESRYFREAHLRKWGKFVCEACSRTLRDGDAHVATRMDAPISDPHDTHCFCTPCHAELMKQARPKPSPQKSLRA